MDHQQLIDELPDIERMPAQQRIQLARQRRADQLTNADRTERALPPPRPRRPRLRFSPEVALLEATGRNDVAEVERLLNDGVDPNVHNEDGLTALHQCAIDDNREIMLLLLRHGADVNAEDTEQWTPLHAAACCAHLNVVQTLIQHGANLLAVNAEGNMPYDICDDEVTLDAIETEMANRGITQNYIDEMRGAPEKSMLEDMKSLHENREPLDARQPDGSTTLHTAACCGYYDVAAFLLRCGVHPNVRDDDLWQPLHAAARWGQWELVELLCEYGADINAKTAQGETPMDLCEDDQTRSTIQQMQQQEARKRRHAFGVRDSRRQSRRRKKFESPQPLAQPQNGVSDNPFSARSAIRRLSLRDKTMTPARIEAAREEANILRSWSKEDVSHNEVSPMPHQNHNSPNKRILKDGKMMSRALVSGKWAACETGAFLGSTKTKPMSPDEWLKKLENNEEHDPDENSPRRVGSQRRRPKNGRNGGGPIEMHDLRTGDSSSRDKRGCCCVIS